MSSNRRTFLISAALGTTSGLMPALERKAAASDTGADQRRDPDIEDFLALSRDLTGEPNLDALLGQEYLGRFRETFGREILNKLVQEHKQLRARPSDIASGIKQDIMSDEYLGEAARQIIYLWYLSAFFMPHPLDPENRELVEQISGQPAGQENENFRGVWQYGTLKQYEAALVWRIIDAHAPMTPGGTMGHWAKKPNAPSKPVAHK